MENKWTFKTRVPDNHKIEVEIPFHIPAGPATVAIEIVTEQNLPSYVTAGDLVDSPLVGIWADRDDISDSSTFIRQLRQQEERRRGS